MSVEWVLFISAYSFFWAYFLYFRNSRPLLYASFIMCFVATVARSCFELGLLTFQPADKTGSIGMFSTITIITTYTILRVIIENAYYVFRVLVPRKQVVPGEKCKSVQI